MKNSPNKRAQPTVWYFGLNQMFIRLAFFASSSSSLNTKNLMDNLLVIMCFIARAYRHLHTTIEIIISFAYLNSVIVMCVNGAFNDD